MSSILGKKLRNVSSMVGMKLKAGQVLGKKLLSDAASSAIQGSASAERLAGRAGRAIDVTARQIGNTAGVIDRSLGRLNPYLSGTVVEPVAVGIRDAAKVTRLLSGPARQQGRELVKLSERGYAKEIEDKLQKFV
jgi:hypothetical protein